MMKVIKPSMRVIVCLLGATLLLGGAVLTALAAPKLKGAVFTTDSTCTVVNQNKYADKASVYLNGGPKEPGAAGLPDGAYYVRVTQPNGFVLGTSVGSGNETPITVLNGEFEQCYQLEPLLVKVSDGTVGFDDTGNKGGVYKVWVSSSADFAKNASKKDNFKVKPVDIEPE
jgi:hypothetical protein